MTIEIMNSYKEANQGNNLPLHEAIENNVMLLLMQFVYCSKMMKTRNPLWRLSPNDSMTLERFQCSLAECMKFSQGASSKTSEWCEDDDDFALDLVLAHQQSGGATPDEGQHRVLNSMSKYVRCLQHVFSAVMHLVDHEMHSNGCHRLGWLFKEYCQTRFTKQLCERGMTFSYNASSEHPSVITHLIANTWSTYTTYYISWTQFLTTHLQVT